MIGTFTLDIELGNDAMRTHGDIAGALHVAARAIGDGIGAVNGILRDANGNRVGSWSIDADPDEQDIEDEPERDEPIGGPGGD